MKIYVASSWRNEWQPRVVGVLRECGHQVYDFRDPPGGSGFGWEEVNPNWESDKLVTAGEQCRMTEHPIAKAGYESDLGALRECEVCVYVLPCGRSASWELGYAMALGKTACLFWPGRQEPELMFRGALVVGDLATLKECFA